MVWEEEGVEEGNEQGERRGWDISAFEEK